ncbi:hypothetical protein KGF57_000104 [Candida theae]|uniref:candidapepsin n=1 Tax=Candida theae TaxID=1198502 RepID=A0AAD5G164_9ASCO|nr:uncharacterized protein KGF57_000104 [Candida theae]KAI5968615.1 hypothetical protein KGF57_000104 [Candida theae]
MTTIATFTRNVLLALAFALVAAQGAAIPEANKRDDSPGFVALDFDVTRNPIDLNATSNAIQKRQPLSIPLYSEGPSYGIRVSVGSDQQEVKVILDTGSSDFWVVDKSATCQRLQFCKAFGTFNPQTSSSFKSLGSSFHIKYGDGTTSDGIWAEDTVSIGGVSITNQQFADVNSTSVNQGILGVSRRQTESADPEYDNVPATLKKQGKIKTNAYSLFLNEPGALTGTIIFGGVDNAKYSGNLVEEKVDIDRYLGISLQSLNYDGNSRSTNFSAVLDSGTTITYLPGSLVEDLAKEVGAFLLPVGVDNELYFINCHKNQGTASFTFDNGAKVDVPLSDFTLQNTLGTCLWGLQNADSHNVPPILGDNFLRHAYVVYNLDKETISLAQVKYTSDSNITAI